MGSTCWSKCTTRPSCRSRIDAGARIVGVNNRNLRTLQVDVHASETLIAQMPRDVDRGQRERAADAPTISCGCEALGYRAFLIGERFMTAADPGAALARAGGASSLRWRKRAVATVRESPWSAWTIMFVKICGITRARGRARRRWTRGAAALGFVFWPGSPRFVDPHRARGDRRGAAAVRDAGRRVRQPAARRT